MKINRFILAVMLMALALAGCASHTWMLTLNDGSRVVAQGKPETDAVTRTVVYVDETGVRQAVSLAQVKSVSRVN